MFLQIFVFQLILELFVLIKITKSYNNDTMLVLCVKHTVDVNVNVKHNG